MFKRNFVRLASMTVVVMALLFLPATPNQATDIGAGQVALALQAPPFVNVAVAAQANPAAFDLGAYLDQEAGISAYYKSPDAINLNQVASVFRTIEMTTTDFIIGSVPVPSYSQLEDAHVYVHRTGWILAYYFRSDPESKIIDMRTYRTNGSLNTTKLQNVLSVVATAAAAPFSGATYYDFRYPSATHILLIGETMTDGEYSFTINPPSSYGYSERGWAVICDNDTCGARPQWILDGVALWTGCAYCYGTISPDKLLPDVTHTFVLSSGTTYVSRGVIILTYRVP